MSKSVMADRFMACTGSSQDLPQPNAQPVAVLLGEAATACFRLAEECHIGAPS